MCEVYRYGRWAVLRFAEVEHSEVATLPPCRVCGRSFAGRVDGLSPDVVLALHERDVHYLDLARLSPEELRFMQSAFGDLTSAPFCESCSCLIESLLGDFGEDAESKSD